MDNNYPIISFFGFVTGCGIVAFAFAALTNSILCFVTKKQSNKQRFISIIIATIFYIILASFSDWFAHGAIDLEKSAFYPFLGGVIVFAYYCWLFKKKSKTVN